MFAYRDRSLVNNPFFILIIPTQILLRLRSDKILPCIYTRRYYYGSIELYAKKGVNKGKLYTRSELLINKTAQTMYKEEYTHITATTFN